jgi:hypothetical protein
VLEDIDDGQSLLDFIAVVEILAEQTPASGFYGRRRDQAVVIANLIVSGNAMGVADRFV